MNDSPDSSNRSTSNTMIESPDRSNNKEPHDNVAPASDNNNDTTDLDPTSSTRGATAGDSAAGEELNQSDTDSATTHLHNNINNTRVSFADQRLPSIDERQEKIIGINLTVSNQNLDIHDFIIFVLGSIKGSLVLNYKKEQQSSITLQDLVKKMLVPDEALQLYKQFFGMTDDIPRNRQGDLMKSRRCAGFYISTNQTHREMKNAVWTRAGGRAGMIRLGWYINPYDDIEPCQKIIAILCGKNTSHGFVRGYAERIRDKLLRQDPTWNFRLTIVTHNDRNSKNEIFSVCGIQIGRTQAKALEAAMRKCGKDFNGLYVKYKSEKSDQEACDKSLDNIGQLPTTYTGIPLVGFDLEGATNLRHDLSTFDGLSFACPIDVEATHLRDRFGKYMVACPIVHVEDVRQATSILLAREPDRHQSDSFPDGPSIQPTTTNATRRTAPTVSDDPYGDLSVLADNTTVHTTMTLREKRQRAIDNLPPPRPIRNDVFADIPVEIEAGAKSYASATNPDDASLGENTFASKMSLLTEENSRLQQSIQSKDETIQSLQVRLDTQEQDAAKAKDDLEKTQAKVAALETHCTTLENTLQKANQEHENQINRLITSHQRDIKIIQDNNDLKRQQDLEEAEKKRQADYAAFEERILLLTGGKRPRGGTPQRDVTVAKMSVQEPPDDAPTPPALPRQDVATASQALQQMSIDPDEHKNMEAHA